MVVTLIESDVALLEALPEKSVDVLIYLAEDRLTPARAKALSTIAAEKIVRPGGAAFIANDIREVWERL